MQGFCDVGSISDPPPGPGRFDLVTCIEVVEHMPEADALAALDTLTRAAPRILFSSSPTDFTEPTHVNVRPVLYWLQAFADRGFAPEWTHNAMYLAPHAMVLSRSEQRPDAAQLRLYAEWVRTRSALVEREQRIGRLSHEAGLAAHEAHHARARIAALEHASAEAEAKAAAAQHRIADQAAAHEAAARAAEAERAEARHLADAHAAIIQDQQLALLHASQALDDANATLVAENRGLIDDRDALRGHAAGLEDQLALRIRLQAAAETRAYMAEKQFGVLQSSTLWRATAPFRRLLDSQPAARGALRAGVRLGKWGMVWRIPRRLEVRRALRAQAAELRAQGFDGPAYLAANPDLAARGVDPALHYVTHGRREGRPVTFTATPTIHLAPPPAPPLPAPSPAPAPPPLSDNPSYAAWIEQNRLLPAALDLQRRLVAELELRPLLSVLTPVYRVAADVLDDTIRSMLAQTYPDWELCLAVGDTGDAARMDVLRAWQARDPRIRVEILAENRGISGNSDAAMHMARGEWALLLDHDDMLTPDALFEMVRALNADPTADFLYSDKDQVGPDGVTRMHPLFKGAWSPDTMLNANYLTHLDMFRMDRLREIGGWDSATDGAQDWDLFLRLIGAKGRVRHVPKMLYHWRQVPTSVAVGGLETKPWAADGQLRTIDRYLATAGWAGATARFDNHSIRVAWPPAFRPSVSILVLPNGPAAIVAPLDWPDAEILAPPGTVLSGAQLVPQAAGTPAQQLDALAARATGDVLIVWDSALAGLDPALLAELVGPLANPDIALVAGQVRGRDGTIQAFGAFAIDGETRPGYAGLVPGAGGPYGNSGWYGNASLAPLRAAALRRTDWRPLAGIEGTARPDLVATLGLPGRILLNPFAVAQARAPGPFDGPPLPDDALPRAVAAALPGGDPFVSPHLVFAPHGWMTFRIRPEPALVDHNYAAEARYCATAYDAGPDLVEASKAACRAKAGQSPRRVAWIIPPFDVAFYGGIHTILRAADFMRREHGVHPIFASLGGDTPDIVRARMAQAFPDLARAAEIQHLPNPDADLECGPVDAVISTLWTTAFPALRANQARRKFYFLQDWEPLFYPAGTVSGLIQATYRFGFHAVCNTPALADSYRELGGTADHFMPAIDPAAFHPRRGGRSPGGQFRLFCYARPSAPRNCFETLAAALQELKRRHGEAIDIVTAGGHWSPAAFGLGGVVRHLGLLAYAETGTLYRACDAGLVAMATRHPSYLPFELMASGAAVVTNRNAHTTWLLKDGENAALFDLTRSDIVRAVESLMQDQVLLDRITAGGLATIRDGHADWDQHLRRHPRHRRPHLRGAGAMTTPGVLLRAMGSRFGDRVFYCNEGRRHWVSDGAWLAQHGFAWPGDVRDVDVEIIEAFLPARNAARKWTAADRATPNRTSVLDIREIMLSGLHGQGLEFGAGAAPLPVPLDCRMRYADVFTLDELRTNFYEGQALRDLIEPDLKSTFERLEGIEDHSLDFIVASHVIEHTSDPIGTLVRSAAKLRPGGSIALIVPDKERTFDKPRPVTPLDHLVEDYRDPSRERDKADFQEFYSLAFAQKPDDYETVWRQKWDEAFPIHYHTWTYDSFGGMVRWIQANERLFSKVWSHHPRDLPDAIEFYYLLTL